MRGTLYPWTGLLITLVLTFVVCLEIEEEQRYSFHARWRLRPRSRLSGKPLVSPSKYYKYDPSARAQVY